MLNRFFHFEKKITPQVYDFEMFEIWREAFKIAKKYWLQLVIADAFFIAIFTAIIWMPWLAKTFPILNEFKLNPDLSQWPPYLQLFFVISQKLWPVLYTLFISFPIYLGLLFVSVCAAYQRPISLKMIFRYINFRSWFLILTLLTLVAMFTLPMAIFLYFFYQKAKSSGGMIQFNTMLVAIGASYMLLIIMFSMTLNLIFIAKQNIIEAFSASWYAVKQHAFKVTGMLLIWYLCQHIGPFTYYLSDIILFPPSYIAWALLYKRMFGEAGLANINNGRAKS